MNVPLTKSLRLHDAATVNEAMGYPIVAYRFESRDIVGEYSPGSGTPINDFLRTFESRYGTEPQVAAVVIRVPISFAKEIYNEKNPPSLEIPGNEFKAIAADEQKIASLISEQHSDMAKGTPSVRPLNHGAGWHPEQADIQISPTMGGKVYFSQFYYWNGWHTSTSALPWTDGFELEVNIRTDNPAYATGARPSCGTAYKEQPFATNVPNSWNWSVWVNTGAESMPLLRLLTRTPITTISSMIAIEIAWQSEFGRRSPSQRTPEGARRNCS